MLCCSSTVKYIEYYLRAENATSTWFILCKIAVSSGQRTDINKEMSTSPVICWVYGCFASLLSFVSVLTALTPFVWKLQLFISKLRQTAGFLEKGVRTGKTTQLVKYLLCKHEELNSNLQHSQKSQTVSEEGRWRQADSQSLLFSPSAQLFSFGFIEKHTSKKGG